MADDRTTIARMRTFARRSLLLVALAVAGVAGGAGAVASIEDHRCAIEPSARRPARDLDNQPVRITFLGDTLLGDAAQPLLDANGYGWPFDELASLLDAEHVVANLEGPITERTEAYARRSRWSYNAQPAAAEAIANAGVTVAGLANNHAMDRGPDGLADTVEALSDAGIASVGAGETASSAELPLLLRTSAGAIAIVAFGDHYGGQRIAANDQAGGANYHPCAIVRAANEARRDGADLVVAFVYWGSNYSEVQPSQRALAWLFVDAGYDLVVGHGPHVVQPVEVLRGVPVLYSLGNFVFGTPGRFRDRFPGYGLIATVEVSSQQLSAIELRCILTDNDRVQFQPRPCPEAEAASVFDAALADVEGLRQGARLELAGS